MLIGNVGKDPELKSLETGNKVVTFSMATSEVYKDKHGEKQEKTEWHNIVMWGNRAEILDKYVKKGSKLYVEGKITTRKWKDKEGNDRYSTEVVAMDFRFLQTGDIVKKNNPNDGQSKPSKSHSQPMPQDDDLPF
jgi:single-strand DNA-binding protein